jgi:prepilin-type processing-associated H-X9-DG protein
VGDDSGAIVTQESDWYAIGVAAASNAANVTTYRTDCQALTPLPTGTGSAGRNWSEGGRNWSNGEYQVTRYNHVLPPNGRSCHEGGGNSPNEGGSTAASSWHPGGVNLALCDGSVRFVQEAISIDIWELIGNRKDGKPVGQF